MKWTYPAPGTVVPVDPLSPDVEVLQRAWIDERGRPRARVVRVHGSRFGTLWAPAWVIAWARPSGAKVWRWVLLMWLDKPADTRSSEQPRLEWLEPDLAPIKPMEGRTHSSYIPHGVAARLRPRSLGLFRLSHDVAGHISGGGV